MSSDFFRKILVGEVARFSPGALAGAILAVALWTYLPIGIYLGGDWTLPATDYQAQQFFYPYMWSSGPNFGSPSLLAAVGLAYGSFVHLVTSLGLPVEYLGKTVLTLVIVLAYFFLYRLLRYFKLGEFASLVGGLIYVTTPVFFNYALMGWQFALLAMALFPLAAQWLCQAMRQDDMRYAIGVAFVWALATLQSQSLVWFPLLFMVFGFYLIHDRESAKVYLKKLGVIFIVFVGLNSYWWFSIILFQDIEITSSAIVMSDISVGADSRFTALNALRLWGGLYNFQYESAISNGWVLGSWLLPALAVMAILVSKRENRRIALGMGFIAFVLPVALFLLKEHREILVAIPGAGLIRQLSRFTVLTSFAYTVLVGIFLDSLSSAKRFPVRLLLYPAVVLLIATTWPWWTGGLTNTNASLKPGQDFRLRVKEFPRAYYEVERHLSNIAWVSRALYLPYGMSGSYKDDPKFRGSYKESVDVFAALSPVPGIFLPSDRPSPIGDYMAFIQHTDDVIAATRFTPTNFYVLRKNMEPGPVSAVFSQEEHYFLGESFDRIWDSKNITIYAKKNPVPLIYSSPVRQQQEGREDALGDLADSELAAHGIAVVLVSQNSGKEDSVARFSAASEVPGAVEYRRINPTKYRIRLHHIRGDVPLLFGESYSRGWRLYPVAYQAREKAASIAKGYVVAPGNERYQADMTEAMGFVERGWISEIGERFISKRFFGAIQNDNLPDGSLMETWYSHSLPEEWHIKVNGYANGWMIDAAQLCSDPQACHRNDDGSFDTEIVMEFWPQQTFYFGFAITGLTLLFSVTSLLRRRRKTGGPVIIS
jgi:hypothetical protein